MDAEAQKRLPENTGCTDPLERLTPWEVERLEVAEKFDEQRLVADALFFFLQPQIEKLFDERIVAALDMYMPLEKVRDCVSDELDVALPGRVEEVEHNLREEVLYQVREAVEDLEFETTVIPGTGNPRGRTPR